MQTNLDKVTQAEEADQDVGAKKETKYKTSQFWL